MYKKLVWVIMAVVFLGNIVTDSQSISEHPIITTDNASQVELLHIIGGGKILDILWSPDGESLFVANQKTIRLFNAQDLAETPSQLDIFHCEWKQTYTNDYCDIKLLFADEFQTLVILEGDSDWRLGIEPRVTYWDIASQHFIEEYNGEFSFDDYISERQMEAYYNVPLPLVINDNRIQLYDEQVNNYVTVQVGSLIVVDAVFNADNTQIASVGNDSIVEIWDVQTRTSRVIASNLGMSLTAVEFSPDSTKLAVGGWDGSLWIFDVATGELLQHFTEDWWVNWNIAFNHDGSMLALGNDNNQVVVYDVVNDYPFLVNRRVFEGHNNIVYGVDFHPNGTQLASASADGNIYIWDVATGTIAHTITGDTFFDVDFHPDGTQLACATQNGHVIIPITATNCQNQRINLGEIRNIAFSPNGEFFAYGNTTILFENEQQYWEELNIKLTVDRIESRQRKLAFSDDGQTLLNAGIFDSTYVWHFDELRHPVVFSGSLMALSPDGTLVAGNQLSIFDTYNGTQLYPVANDPDFYLFNPNSPNLMDAVFSPNGRFIITAPVTGGLTIWGIPPNG